METKAFSPNRPRTPEGWIDYPYDVPYRRQHFIQESFQHPAKMNCFMLEDIVDYVSEPWEVILDPMSGTGTLMLAVLRPSGPRSVICIEDGALFHMYQQMSKEKFAEHVSVDPDSITLLHGPCQEFLPLPCDHVVFSPPYAATLRVKAKWESTQALMGVTYVHDTEAGTSVFDDYLGDSPRNLGRFQPFQYNMEMSRIYKLLFDSVRPGGTMTIVLQDVMRGGKREELTDWAMRTCVKVGWTLKDWFDRHSLGTGMKKSMKKKGYKVVENESVLIFERPAA